RDEPVAIGRGAVVEHRAERLAPDEPLGAVLDYCSAADRDRLVAQLRDAPSAHPSAPQRYRIVRRDGSACWLRILCRQVEI
ncbi:PAS domain-containing sensor histidine kinase, partial [Burkholderia cenocepacia]|nr:PAS domain-containing sensor histidine kinase [Burkholderia cenocepacia]